MRGRVDGLELLDGHVGVVLGGGELRMAQHLLDEADVCPAFQHQRRRGVPEQVAGAVFAEVCHLHVPSHERAEVIWMERLAPAGEEHVASVPVSDLVWPHLGEIPRHPSESPWPDGHDAVPPPLPLPDQDEPASPIEIGHGQPDQLRAAHAGRIEGLQDGAIADPSGACRLGWTSTCSISVALQTAGSRDSTRGNSSPTAGSVGRYCFRTNHAHQTRRWVRRACWLARLSGAPSGLRYSLRWCR
jgi:hypothetical protein